MLADYTLPLTVLDDGSLSVYSSKSRFLLELCTPRQISALGNILSRVGTQVSGVGSVSGRDTFRVAGFYYLSFRNLILYVQSCFINLNSTFSNSRKLFPCCLQVLDSSNIIMLLLFSLSFSTYFFSTVTSLELSLLLFSLMCPLYLSKVSIYHCFPSALLFWFHF